MKRKVKTIPEYLNEDEVERLFRVITNIRDRALFRVAYHRGLRASEPGLLQIDDYREVGHYGKLFVRRLKGSDSASFLMTDVENAAVRAWIRKRGTAPGALFGSRNHRPISRFRVFQLMRHYCKKAGIDPAKAHPHALKHSCGTYLSEHEPDVVKIQDHLGHADIRSTMVYIQITNKGRDEFGQRLLGWGRKKS
jgi:site-specific recombinase XerD